MTGRLVGVGVGPGDPELLTVRALRVLREARVIFVPAGPTGEAGRAEAVVRGSVGPERVRRLPFALSGDARPGEPRWEEAAREVCRALDGGGVVAFATLGDPGLYSTFTPLARTLRRFRPKVRIETVPGITAMQDLAARSGAVLAVGSERLALVPCGAGVDDLPRVLEGFDTVVLYKAGVVFPEVVRAVRRAGRLDGLVRGVHLGLPGEEIAWGAAVPEEPAPYLTTAVVLPARDGEGWEP